MIHPKTVPALAITSVRHPAFILTHEADKKGEVQKEAELLGLMETDEALQIPICVVAKERLLTPDEDGDVAEDLMIAVKRAALRKSFSAVVYSAKDVVAAAFDVAAKALLSVPPEQLEEYVFERGYKEGVQNCMWWKEFSHRRSRRNCVRFLGPMTPSLPARNACAS